jgi:spore maturation protein CgeB
VTASPRLPLTILYSYNKRGFEADYWFRELRAASDERYTFIPFNHDPYLNVARYSRAQLLDNLWYDRNPALLRMYADVTAVIAETGAQVLLVDNSAPYHPEFLRTLPIYKVLRTTDGPLVAYDRDFPYVHAYDHVLYHSPAYSRDLDMRAKLLYVGARRVDFWPLAVFDALFDHSQTEESLFGRERDVDLVFVGSMFRNKLPLLAKVKKAFGRRFRLHGRGSWKMKLYWNVKFGFPGWIRTIRFDEFVPLYHRTKIGINVHNRGDYTVGGYRLFELPANGVMQISDGGEYLSSFFDVGTEIVGYRNADDLIDKIRYYLAHDDERLRIARNGYRRVMRDHRMPERMREAGVLIERGMRAADSSTAAARARRNPPEPSASVG